jgi:hypothetical protein
VPSYEHPDISYLNDHGDNASSVRMLYVCACDICGNKIVAGETYYSIDGTTICREYSCRDKFFEFYKDIT